MADYGRDIFSLHWFVGNKNVPDSGPGLGVTQLDQRPRGPTTRFRQSPGIV